MILIDFLISAFAIRWTHTTFWAPRHRSAAINCRVMDGKMANMHCRTTPKLRVSLSRCHRRALNFKFKILLISMLLNPFEKFEILLCLALKSPTESNISNLWAHITFLFRSPLRWSNPKKMFKTWIDHLIIKRKSISIMETLSRALQYKWARLILNQLSVHSAFPYITLDAFVRLNVEHITVDSVAHGNWVLLTRILNFCLSPVVVNIQLDLAVRSQMHFYHTLEVIVRITNANHLRSCYE